MNKFLLHISESNTLLVLLILAERQVSDYWSDLVTGRLETRMPTSRPACLRYSTLSLWPPASWYRPSPSSSPIVISSKSEKRKPSCIPGSFSVSPRSWLSYRTSSSALVSFGHAGMSHHIHQERSRAGLILLHRYATAGLDLSPGAAGPVFLVMFFYEMLYTGIGMSLVLKCVRVNYPSKTLQRNSLPHTPQIHPSPHFSSPSSSRSSSLSRESWCVPAHVSCMKWLTV